MRLLLKGPWGYDEFEVRFHFFGLIAILLTRNFENIAVRVPVTLLFQNRCFEMKKLF
jgi:hypothetical protein